MQRAETPKSNLREAIRNAAGPVTFSNRTLLAYAYPSYATFFVFDLLPIIGDLDKRPVFIEWFAVATVGYLAVVAVMLIFRATLLPATFRKPKVLLTAVALLIAGLARAVAVNLAGTALGVISLEDVPFRLAAGPVLTLGIISTISIYLASVMRSEDAVTKLRREKAVLDELRGSIRERIKFQRDEIIRQINSALQPVINQLEASGGNAREKVALLTSAVDEVVRPMSKTIGKVGVPTAATDSLDRMIEQVVKERQRLPKRVSLGNQFVPLIIAFTTTTAGSGALIGIIGGPVATIAVPVLALGIFIFFRIIQRLTRNIWLPVWAVAFAVIPLAALPTLGVSLLLLVLGVQLSLTIYLQFYLLVLVSSAISLMMQISRTLRNESEQQLRDVVADLELVNSELRQQVWHNQRRIASILHGSVQSAIYAGALKLSQSANPDSELITQIRRDVDSAIFRLHSETETADVSALIEQISQVWQGVANIELRSFDNQARALLAGNSVASYCLIEVVREAVTNAIKHGRAKNVLVTIGLEGEKLLDVEVRNDGEDLAKSDAAGFGTELLNELSHEWVLRRDGDETVLRAKVPVSKISR